MIVDRGRQWCAVRLFPRRGALAGQLPLVLVMVGYTVGGLLLLFGD
ncbi:hypothetical protein [Kribbella sancticallisti]